MPRLLNFILFFLTVATLIIFIHYYFWIRLFRDTGLSEISKISGVLIIIIPSVFFVIAMVSSQVLSLKYSFPLLWMAYLWLGIVMLMFFSLIFTDLLRLVFFLYTKLPFSETFVLNPERRQFISVIIAIGVLTVTLIMSVIGVKNYFAPVTVKTINISLPGLPEVFKGFKIVQISDLHVGQLMTKTQLEKVVQQTNRLEPDLIAITGDLTDGSIKKLLNETKPIKDLEARYGVYFVTGNHEYYSGVQSWVPAIENMGIQVLANESVKIQKDGQKFYLIGVNDHEAKRFDENHKSDFEQAFSGLDDNLKKILLAHQPLLVKDAAKYNVDLVLAGHTHGGQIWPFNYLVYLQQPFLKGFYEYKNTKLYVNQGTGCWGPPMRLGSENEITEIILGP